MIVTDKQPQLDTPYVRVTMSDGRTYDVQTENPDMILWDLERHKRKWPSFQEAPFLWLNYLAYSKLNRTGQLSSEPFDRWMLKTSRVENLNAEGVPDDDVVTAFPTQEAAALG